MTAVFRQVRKASSNVLRLFSSERMRECRPFGRRKKKALLYNGIKGGMMMTIEFPQFQAAQIRIARPTGQLKEIIRFYEEGLGLKRIGSFSGHEGYSGVMFGLPHTQYHLEFTEET